MMYRALIPGAGRFRKAADAVACISLASLSFLLIFSPLYAGLALDSLRKITAAAALPPIPSVESPSAGSAAPSAASRPLSVYFISVGQGDAAYIELPNGKNALIDGGPSNPADGSLAKFLAGRNVTGIDYVVLTHPHSDHYTGLQYVFSSFTVGGFYDTRMDNARTAADNMLREKIRGLGVGVTYPAPGDALAWDPGGVDARVLNSCPVSTQSVLSSAINDCSIVIKLAYQNSSILFTGDIGKDVESALVSKYGGELQADAIKVAHHGSDSSSSEAFLAAVKPRDAYISVGAGNTYGHPTLPVLARLQAAGAAVHRTDTDGTQNYIIGAAALSSPVQYLAFMP